MFDTEHAFQGAFKAVTVQIIQYSRYAQYAVHDNHEKPGEEAETDALLEGYAEGQEDGREAGFTGSCSGYGGQGQELQYGHGALEDHHEKEVLEQVSGYAYS